MSSEVAPNSRLAVIFQSTFSDVIASLRLVLVAYALVFVALEGCRATHEAICIGVLLFLFAAHAFLLWLPALRRLELLNSLRRQSFWIDITCFLLIFAVSQTNQRAVFLGGFLFANLAASFSSGHHSGLKLGVISTIASAIVLILFHQGSLETELNQLSAMLFLLILITGLTALLVSQIEVQRELKLLHEVVSFSNSALTADRTIAQIVDKLRLFYRAEAAAILEGSPKHCRLWQTEGSESKQLFVEVVSEALRSKLVDTFGSRALVYSRGWSRWFSPQATYSEVGVGKGKDPAVLEPLEQVATIFEAESLLTAPLVVRLRPTGRIFLSAKRPQAFSNTQASGLVQMLSRVSPVIENVCNAGELAAAVRGLERTKIACDIHDSVIQPYLGIQLGLTALRRKVAHGDSNLEADIARLLAMTDGEIYGLRRYMEGLKGTRVDGKTLLELIKRFSEKFSAASGIAVEIRNGSKLNLSDQLAEEVFQIIAEGLSNIRRHTNARRAVIHLSSDSQYFHLVIEDQGSPEQIQKSFTPRSIQNRTRVLGGEVHVQRTESGGTAVIIQIPL